MKRKLISVLILISAIFLVSCNGNKAEESHDAAATDEARSQSVKTVVIAGPRSPASLPVLRMQEKGTLWNGSKIEVKLYPSMEAMVSLAQSDDVDFMLIPSNTAAVLHNRDFRIKIMNIFQWGGLYLSSTDPACTSWDDLKGKTLYVPAKGSVPDLATQLFLKKNGLAAGENLEVVYSNHGEIAQLLSSGRISYAVDVQPFVTANLSKLDGYHIISDYSKDWPTVAGSGYRMPGFCMIAKDGTVDESPADIDQMNTLFEQALNEILGDTENAGMLAEKYMNANPELIKNAMSGFGMSFEAVDEAIDDVEHYFTILNEMRSEVIGGKIPDGSIFHDGTE